MPSSKENFSSTSPLEQREESLLRQKLELQRSLAVIDKRIQELEALEEELLRTETQENTATPKIEIVEQAATEAETELREENLKTAEAVAQKKGWLKKWRKKITYLVLLPTTVAAGMASYFYNPKDYYQMSMNWKERHIDKKESDDPTIKGIDTLYTDEDIEKATYDFIGQDRINYKFGYYTTSVFDLSDSTPPEFKLIKDRNFTETISPAAGITTNVLNPFKSYDETVRTLRQNRENDAEIGGVAVIAYNAENLTLRAGKLREFGPEWMLSITNEKILDFQLNEDGSIPLVYDPIVLRMVPVMSINPDGSKNTFQIGVTRDRSITKINPLEATRFGTLEGGKALLVCGEKQIQVNGSFADIYRVYEKLKKDFPGQEIHSYLLDNGAYNLPIWDNDNLLTKDDVRQHLLRHYAGGYALVLLNNDRVSPYEYQNKYKEIKHSIEFAEAETKNETSSVSLSISKLEIDNENFLLKTAFEKSAHVVILEDGTRHTLAADEKALANTGICIKIKADSSGNISLAQVESVLEFLKPRIERYQIPIENILPYTNTRSGNSDTRDNVDLATWSQIQKLLEKKFYKKETPALSSAKENQMVGMYAYQEAFRLTRNHEYSLGKARQTLTQNKVSDRNINRTLSWIEKRVMA